MNSQQEEKNQALTLLENELKYLMETPLGRRSFLAAVPFLLASCATGEKTRYREGDNTGQETTLSVEDEVRLTQEVLPQMKKDYPPHPNKEANRYIAEIGHNIVKANKLAGNPYDYRFTLVNVDMVNAFALPAGEIMVTAPLVKMADSEAELAGVIGHEIGHVVARHTAERMDAAKKAQKKSLWYAIGGGLIGGAGGVALGSLMCRKTDPEYRECMARAATYGAAAGAGGGLLIQKYVFMANSREDEMEADRVGFRTSVATRYSKDHVGLFYEKLLKMEQQSRQGQNKLMASLADAMSTHPPSKERVKQMRRMSSSESKNPKAIVSTRQFDKVKKILGA